MQTKKKLENKKDKTKCCLPFVCIVGAVFQKLRSRLFPQEAKIFLIHCEEQRKHILNLLHEAAVAKEKMLNHYKNLHFLSSLHE